MPSSTSSDNTCNSRSLTWLLNPCIPKSHSHLNPTRKPEPEPEPEYIPDPSISALPDDLLLTILARAPPSSLPSLSSASLRFSLLLSSPLFFPLRRSLFPLSPSLLSLSLSSPSHLSISTLHSATWRTSTLPLPYPISHPTFVPLDNLVFVIGRESAVKLDTWTAKVSPISAPLFPRKKFAAAIVKNRIFVAGGSSRTSAVEIYDPEIDTWRISASDAPSRRYGCVGAAAGGSFCVAGGLMIGEARAAHVTAGTVEVWDHVRWGRTGRVPGGGCVVGACGVGTTLYVIASNAVEITFWRWDLDKWEKLVGPPVKVGMMGVRFSCCAVRDGRMAATVHVSSRGGGGGGGQNGDFASLEGVVLLYDVESGEWSRGVDLPGGFRRAGLVCVEC